MLTIETKELNISEELRKKVDMISKFAYAKPTYDTPREEEINNYIYEQNYEIDKDYDDRDIDI